MQIIITDKSDETIKSAQSADGRYTWFWGSDGYLVDTVAGRSIYQMGYMLKTGFGADPLPDDVAQDVRDFWEQLDVLRDTHAQAWRAQEAARWDDEVADCRRPLTPAEQARARNDQIDADDAYINS